MMSWKTIIGLRALWALAALGALGALASPATAAPTKKPPAAKAKTPEQKEADRHFKSGVALFGEQKFGEALAEFQRAYEIAPATIVLYNMAACHRELSHYGESVKLYKQFLDEGAGKQPAERLAAAKAELDGILARIARVSVTAPDGAALELDGKALGAMPVDMPLLVAPGEHTLTAHLEGKKDGAKTIRVASGDEVEITLRLADPPKPEPRERVVVVREHEDQVPKRFRLTAAFGTNLKQAGDTGVPVIGLGVPIGSRLELAVDVTLVAYAVMPSVRVRLVGDRASLHLIGAVPIAFTDGGMNETFVAGAGGLGLRLRATPTLAFHIESYAAFASKGHGTTFPAFVGGELWF